MTILIEDTQRNNLAAWAIEAFNNGFSGGAVLSPFSTPTVANNYKSSGGQIANALGDAGCEVWFDATTHAIQMPGVGDFRFYDGWDLWEGTRGDLVSRALQRDHVRRVLETQQSLGAKALGPTILLSGASGAGLALAHALAEAALEADADAFLSVAGSPSFWSGGDDLDAFIGAIAQLGATGYFLTVVRPTTDLPVASSPEETAGLCRTVRSLQQFGRVHVSHGDLAALPAVAAGARSVGSGWDVRQRVCGFTSYLPRDPEGAGGGGWFRRPTFGGLFGFLTRAEAERLATQDAEAAGRLHPGPLHPDGPKEAFMHHVFCLSALVDELAELDFEARYRRLDELYVLAGGEWPLAAQAASMPSAADAWTELPQAGLRLYGQTEGWAP